MATKAAEEENATLLRSAALFRSILAGLPDEVAVLGADGAIRFANPAYRAARGDSAPEPGQLEQVRRSGAAVRYVERTTGPDGAPRVCQIALQPLPAADAGPRADAEDRAPDGQGGDGRRTDVLIVAHDVSGQRGLDRQILAAQRMEALGTLAAGIAHDFNNVLFGILGYAELVRLDVPPDSLAARNLVELMRAASRARDLVERIQAFGRQTEADIAPLPLGVMCQGVLELVRAGLPETVALTARIDSDPVVAGNAGQLAQVLVNLCANAVQAMPRGGDLSVSVEGVELGPDAAARGGVAEGRYALLAVGDTGHGIPDAVRERIFEPFFTTRDVGGGTGLGLAVVHGIVTAHGGAISVESAVGRGTTFRILLPLAEPGLETERQEGPREATRTAGRLLVVDDEPGVGQWCCEALAQVGYHVVATQDGSTALDLLRREPPEFDLLMTDLAMPGLSGIELAEEARRVRPNLPILLASGLPVLESRARAAGVGAIVAKPLVLRELAAAIRRLLQPRRAPGGTALE